MLVVVEFVVDIVVDIVVLVVGVELLLTFVSSFSIINLSTYIYPSKITIIADNNNIIIVLFFIFFVSSISIFLTIVKYIIVEFCYSSCLMAILKIRCLKLKLSNIL